MEQRVRLYLSKTIELAKSVTFKCEDLAASINAGLIELGYAVDEEHQDTWKYYLNLAGQYHETNKKMFVVSLDTLETIEFTTQNMSYHRSTLNAYKYGTRFYHELVRLYPGQETLIHSIVTPVDIDLAIEAKDGQILSHDPTLVDPNETDLIPRLEAWVQGWLFRWNTPAYALVDGLYIASMLGVLYTQMTTAILAVRQSSVHTSRAHGFHVREHLASYQRLDEFYELLTLDQRLFLYRNLDYIAANAGNRQTFDLLIENILTRRGISLLEYDYQHTHERVPHEQLEPNGRFIGTNRNFRERNIYGRTESLEDQVSKLNGLAPGNPDNAESDVAYLANKGPKAMLTQLPTKTLEARAVDNSAGYEVSLEDMLINHWVYLSSKNQYSATVPVTNPVTGLAQSLSSSDAWVVYFYCWLRGQGVTLDTIPTFLATTVQRPTLPTLDTLEGWYGESDHRLTILRDRLEPYGLIQQPIGFYEKVSQIHTAFLHNTWLYKADSDHLSNGRLRLIHQRCYQDVEVDLYAGEPYREWLLDHGVVIEDFNQYDFTIFGDEILRRFTGMDVSESDSVRRILNAMVAIMGRLSSYNVQYIPFLENENYYNLQWVTDRLADTGFHGKQYEYVDKRPYRAKVAIKALSEHPMSTVVPLDWHRLDSRSEVQINTRVEALAPAKVFASRMVEQASIHVQSVTITERI